MTDPSSNVPIYEVPTAVGAATTAALRFLERRRHAQPSRRIGAGILAAAGTLALHALLLGPLIWGSSLHKAHRPDRQGAGASAVVSDQEPAMTLILIDEPRITPNAESSDEAIASRGFAPKDLPISIASPDPTPAFDLSQAEDTNAEHIEAQEVAGDQSGRALLFGRYMGQITARIERAWLRPRTPIGAVSFSCRVQIVQDRSGDVKETTLQNCNGGADWQLSLVRAIQSASPLPAPPDPGVFVDALTVSFSSGPFVEGTNDEGFEPETRVATNGPSPARDNAAPRLADPLPGDALRDAMQPAPPLLAPSSDGESADTPTLP